MPGSATIACVELASTNEEAIGAWNGVLFDRFSKYRHIVVTGLEPHGEEALRTDPPLPGDSVLDIGCGFGDTTRRLAELAGPEGSAVGIDAAERFIDKAREEADETGAENVRFLVGDLEVTDFEDRFDYAFSRMGTMFFGNPGAAMRNVRRSMVPGVKLCTVVWRQKIDNEWLYRAEHIVEEWVEEDPESDELTCGPGPFSMANADTVSGILLGAGFEEIALRRCDLPFRMGGDIEEAVAYVMALGPAGEVLRLAGDDAKRLEPEIVAALREGLGQYVEDDGSVWGNMSSWVVTARVPDA
jgi:ubiquinone/menaquinone biosynthesis C-methylase UbiE